jgi:phage tail tape-measure protein
MLGHVVLEHQLALLAVRVEDDQRLAFGQCLAHAQHAGFQRRVIAIVGAVAGDEIFDEAGEGVDFKLVVGDEHGHLG